MAGYKERVSADLDRWIADGHVAADKREAILASIPEARRLDAASALAWIGAILLGVALIAFIAANWEGMPRLARFAIVLGVFLGAAGAAAWSAHKQRPAAANALLTFAALAFAAGVGLTGQIFDIVGEPRAALYGSAIAAALLALAGGASGPAIVCLMLLGIADFLEPGSGYDQMPWLVMAAPIGAFLALRWKSAPLAHAGALGIIIAFIWFASRADNNGGAMLLFFSIWLGAMAYGGRMLALRGRDFGGVFYGWFAWGALLLFAVAGYADGGAGDFGIVHRLAWLGAAGALVAIGRHDRHSMVSAAGIIGLIAAIAALLTDLGLDLIAAAALFFLAAIAALVVGLVLRRRAKA